MTTLSCTTTKKFHLVSPAVNSTDTVAAPAKLLVDTGTQDGYIVHLLVYTVHRDSRLVHDITTNTFYHDNQLPFVDAAITSSSQTLYTSRDTGIYHYTSTEITNK